MPDHDRLFKELLATFFLDFVELFAPELAREIEPGSLDLLDKEVLTDVTAGERQVVDLLARVRLRAGRLAGGRAQVLVHVETQAQPEREFARRMFRYFAGIDLKHALPVYPIAVLSFERPRRPQPARFDLRLPGLHVLAFRFRAVQLNRLEWRAFLRRRNPVAAALMSRMRIARGERVRVKVECLRLLATLQLDPARMRLVSGFVDTYLHLTGSERTLFDKEIRRVPEDERGKVMEIVTSWMEEGIQKGLVQGRQEGREEGRQKGSLELVLRLLTRRLGALADPAAERVRRLPLAELETLAEALLDFRTPEDLERWLSEHES